MLFGRIIPQLIQGFLSIRINSLNFTRCNCFKQVIYQLIHIHIFLTIPIYVLISLDSRTNKLTAMQEYIFKIESTCTDLWPRDVLFLLLIISHKLIIQNGHIQAHSLYASLQQYGFLNKKSFKGTYMYMT